MSSSSKVLMSLLADEDALAVVRRVARVPLTVGVSFIDNQILHGGDILELCGGSGTGKSEIAMHIAAKVLLRSLRTTGRLIKVLYFDNDYKFNESRFEEILHNQAKILLAVPDPPLSTDSHQGDTVEAALAKIRGCFKLFRCSSTFQFFCTLLSCQEEISDGTEVLVLLDSLASFHWQDKMLQQHVGPGLGLQHAAVAGVKRFIEATHCYLVAVKPSLSSVGKDYMPRQWQELVKARVFLGDEAESKSGRKNASSSAGCLWARMKDTPKIPFRLDHQGVVELANDGLLREVSLLGHTY